VTADDVIDRLLAFGEAATGSLPSSIPTVTVAIGWATVELERAVGELAEALGIPAARFVPAAVSEVLGARCLVADAVLPGGSALVVLEPATEGRLAATLARFGEGPAAIWLAARDEPGADGVAPGGGPPMTSGRLGPLGVERLILGGQIHGPHRLLVGLPGTIHA